MLFEQAMEYAEAVLSGEEVTTKYVKKQCQWFINDIYNKDEDFPYYFDLEAIEKVEGILRLLNFATGLGVVGMSVLDGLVGFQAFNEELQAVAAVSTFVSANPNCYLKKPL